MELGTVQLARLLPGATRVDEGNISETWRGDILTTDGDTVVAYVKACPDNQILSEVVCALVGRALKLPIPQPFLVVADYETLPDAATWRQDSEGVALLYGSHDAGAVSFKRMLNMHRPSAQKLFAQWRGYSDTAIFDEWVANTDRHTGNILFESSGEFWLIDHGHALTGPHWTPGDLAAFDVQVANKLLDRINPHLKLPDRRDYRHKANETSKRFLEISFNELNNNGLFTILDTNADAVTDFLHHRASVVAQLVSNRLGIGELGLKSP